MGSDLSFQNVELPPGHVVIVTGGNTGIGYEISKQISKMGASVIMACRSEQRASAAITKIQDEVRIENLQSNLSHEDSSRNNPKELLLKYVHLDLASLQSTRDFADTIKAMNTTPHILICNAGIGFTPKTITEDGFELMFQVNYLSHFLLVSLLLPSMQALSAQDKRILFVTSDYHRGVRFDLNVADARTPYDRANYYSASKLFQIMFVYCLDRRLTNSNVTVSCVHPGMVDSEFSRGSQDHWFYRTFWMLVRFLNLLRSPLQGACTAITCAVSPELQRTTGHYYMDCKAAEPSDAARVVDDQEILWEYSVKCVEQYLPSDLLQALMEKPNN